MPRSRAISANAPRRQRRLAASEQQFRLLVQGVTDYAIYMLDREGRVSSWNSGAQRIKGYTAEEILGEHFSAFYTERGSRRGVTRQGPRRGDGRGSLGA